MDNVDQVARYNSSRLVSYSCNNNLARLRRCLLLAALACVLRPTNLLIWAYLGFSTLLGTRTKEKLHLGDKAGRLGWFRPLADSFLGAKNRERMVLVRETAVCGSVNV